MSQAATAVKKKVLATIRRALVIAAYLFVVFCVFDFYKSVILADYRLDLLQIGLSLINALALAKIILIGQEVNLADQFRDFPLIYPTLLKSFVYTLLLAFFKVIEKGIVAVYHGRPFSDSLMELAAGSWKGLGSLTVVLFVVLIPFFGFGELQRRFGDDITQAFWRRQESPALRAAPSE